MNWINIGKVSMFQLRSSLDSAEQDIEHLEAKLERLVKVCNIMIETGKTFKKASSDFIVGVRDLASYFKTDDLLNNCLSKFAHEMTEMLKYFTILLDQANRSVCQNIQKLIKTDIKKVKDSRKDFEKISDDLDSALNRNSNVPRTKVQECEEAKNILTAKRSCFAHASLDYVFQINVLHSKKRFDVLETMLSFMHAHSTYFHQGHDLFNEFDPEMKSITVQVDELRVKATQERREMEERHTLVQKKKSLEQIKTDRY
ncbi:ACAP [Mytilus coruscus]|uniref:ACAP n=1 Tax=Mytilus coruscus TaxID=42192 RepID=A0A6J8BF08_MYTCO|nr:ACAP [Mytilus coruscus]